MRAAGPRCPPRGTPTPGTRARGGAVTGRGPEDADSGSAPLSGTEGQLLLSERPQPPPSSAVQGAGTPGRWQVVAAKGPGAPNHQAELQLRTNQRGVEGSFGCERWPFPAGRSEASSQGLPLGEPSWHGWKRWQLPGRQRKACGAWAGQSSQPHRPQGTKSQPGGALCPSAPWLDAAGQALGHGEHALDTAAGRGRQLGECIGGAEMTRIAGQTSWLHGPAGPVCSLLAGEGPVGRRLRHWQPPLASGPGKALRMALGHAGTSCPTCRPSRTPQRVPLAPSPRPHV